MTDPALQEEWQTRTHLLPHQQEAVAKLLPSRVGALFAEMGTGKSRIVIELARLRQRKIDRVVWFCPVSAKETIHREILKHVPGASIHVFDHRTSEHELPPAYWYVVGTESIGGSARVYLTAAKIMNDRTMVAVDESHQIKGHQALRTNRLTVICKPARYRLVLTGTPISQGTVDLFAQMRFLSPRILGYRSFWAFARNHIIYSDRFPGRIDAEKNTDRLAARIQPYVYQITKAECLTLPGKLYTDRYCPLSAEQLRAYAQAKDDFLDGDHMFGDEWERAIEIFRLFTRLQSIVCGFDGPDRTLKHNRIHLLHSTLDAIPDKEPVVIWAKYHHCIREIVESLPPGRTHQFHGHLAECHRQRQLDTWREEGGYLVATQASGGASIDLTRSAYVVYYANGFKFFEREQSEDRCHRIGQTRSVTYVDLWSDSGIDARIEKALRRKGNVVESFRREVQAVRATNKDRLRDLVQTL